MRLIQQSLNQRKIVMLLVMIAVILGALSYLDLPRQEDPDFSVGYATIVTSYPGAAPQEVEQLVSKVLEEKLLTISEIKIVSSNSFNNFSSISLQLEPGVDKDKVWDEVRNRISDAKANLPEGAEEPVLNTKLLDTVGFVIALSSEEQSYSRLDEAGKDLKKKIEQIHGVGEVELIGVPEDRITVALDLQRLALRHIYPSQVLEALGKSNPSIPGGMVEVEGIDYALRPEGQFRSIDDVAGSIVTMSPNQRPVYLKDVASVYRESLEEKEAIRLNGKKAVIVTVSFKENLDVGSLGREVRKEIKAFQQNLPSSINVETVIDQPLGVDARLSGFTSSLLLGMALVGFIIFVSLGSRNALVVALAIPTSIFISFAFMGYFGVKLHQVSIVSLVIALGMVVDNAIVVSDNITRKLDEGYPALEAAKAGTTEVARPIISSTFTTVAAFIPLFLMQGETGEYVRMIPFVVSLALIASLLIALFVTPVFSFWLIRADRQKKDFMGWGTKVLDKYIATVKLVLRYKTTTLVITLVALGLSLAMIPWLGLQFFPKAERSQFVIDFYAPGGTQLKDTLRAVEEIEQELAKEPSIKSYIAFVGRGSPKFYYNIFSGGESPNYAQLVVNVKEEDLAEVPGIVAGLQRNLKEKIALGQVEVLELEQGPPVGAPISIKIKGEDIDQLREIASEVKDILKETEGTSSVRDSMGYERLQMKVKLDEEVLKLYGLDKETVAWTLRVAFQGEKAGTLIEGDEEREIFVKMSSEETGIEQVRESVFPTKDGRPIPFRAIGEVEPEWNLSGISRENGSRNIVVRSQVEEGFLPYEVMESFKGRLLNLDLPPGYTIEMGGENEERDESFASLGSATIIAVVLIYLILVLEFNSLSQPLLIVISIPLTLIGAVLGLLITGNPIGFMAFMGLVSLSGIVVNNAIVLLEFINEHRKELSVEEAVVEACRARLRPILLTTFTTIGGIFPLALTGGTLWAPMGYVIIFGLLVSTLLTLVIFPLLYVLSERLRSRIGKTSKVSVEG